MKSLGELFRREFQHHSETAQQSQAPAPSRQEIFNYLGQLADDYHLPRKLVYSVADAESGLNVKLEHKNYAHKRGHPVKDKSGNSVVDSVDYGLMQINSKRIGHDVIRDASGHKFKIDDSVIHDWKANARAGVAILKHDYELVELAEGHGVGADDTALGTYSAYNHGTRHWHSYIDKDKHGFPRIRGIGIFSRNTTNTQTGRPQCFCWPNIPPTQTASGYFV